jgi:hypothetical protein
MNCEEQLKELDDLLSSFLKNEQFIKDVYPELVITVSTGSKEVDNER